MIVNTQMIMNSLNTSKHVNEAMRYEGSIQCCNALDPNTRSANKSSFSNFRDSFKFLNVSKINNLFQSLGAEKQNHFYKI